MAKLKLIASLPGKSLENKFNMCTDGRGGWTLSQINVDRVIGDYAGYYLVFCLGVLVEDAIEEDWVKSTRLTAEINGSKIGTNVRTWQRRNSMWNWRDGEAIFEWAQNIDLEPTTDGLITVSLEAKLNSMEDWLPVEGQAYCRIQKVDFERTPPPRRWESPLLFSLREFLPKRFRRRNSYSTTKTGAG